MNAPSASPGTCCRRQAPESRHPAPPAGNLETRDEAHILLGELHDIADDDLLRRSSEDQPSAPAPHRPDESPLTETMHDLDEVVIRDGVALGNFPDRNAASISEYEIKMGQELYWIYNVLCVKYV